MEPILVPTVDGAAPASFKKRAEGLTKRIAELERRRGERAASARALEETPLSAKGVMAHRDACRSEAYDDLAIEMHIREDLAVFFREYEEALRELQRSARVAFEEAKSSIRQKLLDLGYREPTGVPDPSAIQPIFILSHPSVRGASARVDELSGRLLNRELAQANEASIAKLQTKIRAAREELAAA